MANDIVKIWFSKPDMEHPLGGSNNVERLKKHLKDFPHDKISLVSNYTDFSEEKRKKLFSICEELGSNVTLIDFYSIKKEIQNSNASDREKQLKLFDCAVEEIKNDLGCLAAASDIARILSPIANLGIYFDLDDLKLLDIPVDKAMLGLLLAIKATTIDGNFKVLEGNNTPLMCNESKNTFLSKYRDVVFSYYSDSKKLDFLYKSILECEAFQKGNNEFNLKMANMVLERVKEKILRNDGAKKQNLFPLLIRTILKELKTEKKLDEEQYKRAYKAFVILCSGPDCMKEAVESYFDHDFLQDCEKKGVQQSELLAVITSVPIVLKYHSHENDVAWVGEQNAGINNNDSNLNNASSSNNSATLLLSNPLEIKLLETEDIKKRLQEVLGGSWSKKGTIFWIRLSPAETMALRNKLDNPEGVQKKVAYTCMLVKNSEDSVIQIEKDKLDVFFKNTSFDKKF